MFRKFCYAAVLSGFAVSANAQEIRMVTNDLESEAVKHTSNAPDNGHNTTRSNRHTSNAPDVPPGIATAKGHNSTRSNRHTSNAPGHVRVVRKKPGR